MTSRAQLMIVLAGTAALVLSGCNSDTDEAATTSSTASQTTATTTVTSSTTVVTAAAPTSTPATPNKVHLVAVRTSATGTGDRISFEFDGAVPGYSLTSAKAPIKSGDTSVEVAGQAVSQIAFESASGADLTGGAKVYYNGSKRITPTDAKLVNEVVAVSDNEARMTWAIGHSSAAKASISTVASPPQIIVDVTPN